MQGEKGDYIKGTGMPTCNDPRISTARALSGMPASVATTDTTPIPGGTINPVMPIFADGSSGIAAETPNPIPEPLLASTPIFTANGSTVTGAYNSSQLAGSPGPVPAPETSTPPGLNTGPVASTGSSATPTQTLAPVTAPGPDEAVSNAAEASPPPPALVPGPSQVRLGPADTLDVSPFVQLRRALCMIT